MSIRNEVAELGNSFSALYFAIAANDEDKATKIISGIFNVIKEGADFAKIPQEERLKASLLAAEIGMSNVMETVIKFSDEQQ